MTTNQVCSSTMSRIMMYSASHFIMRSFYSKHISNVNFYAAVILFRPSDTIRRQGECRQGRHFNMMAGCVAQ